MSRNVPHNNFGEIDAPLHYKLYFISFSNNWSMEVWIIYVQMGVCKKKKVPPPTPLKKWFRWKIYKFQSSPAMVS